MESDFLSARLDEYSGNDRWLAQGNLLRSISDRKIRNLIRGVFSAQDATIARKTIERLRRECSSRDAKVVLAILRDHPGARELPKTVAFPRTMADIEEAPYFNDALLEIELVELGLRLERHIPDLLEAVELVGRLNEAILSLDHARVDAAFSEYRRKFGISYLVAQKAMSLRHAVSGTGEQRAEVGAAISPFNSPKRHAIAVAFEDSIDHERDYIRTRRTFSNFAVEDKLDRYDASIVGDLFQPCNHSTVVLALRAQAYGRLGLLDSLAWAFRSVDILRYCGESDQRIERCIPPQLRVAWRGTFDRPVFPLLLRAIGIPDHFFDKSLFSHLPAWSEYPDLLDYRLRTERAIGDRLDGRFPVLTPNAALMAAPCKQLSDMLFEGPLRPTITDIDPKTAGGFHRSAALLSSIENGTLGEFDGEALWQVLDQTIDISTLLSIEELSRFLPTRRDDALYELLRTALRNEVEESKVSSHALRRALQAVVRERFDGDIVALLEYLYTERNHVSGHFYNIFSEAFLTELYDLFDQTDDVTNAHARILEWWGEKANDEDAKFLARSHRLALRLRKVRGAIEETRIYVDPLRFVGWIQENKSSELRALALDADQILSDTDKVVNLKDKVQLALDPLTRLAGLLDDCFKEFCNNKQYGVTAFIGRRVRHGTLHGHLVVELKPEIDAIVDEFQYSAPAFSLFLRRWFDRFDAAVLTMAAERIHVHHPKERSRGLIIASIDDADKTRLSGVMLADLARSLAGSQQVSQVAARIHDYCWLLFESDLKRTRGAVEDLQRDFVVRVEDHLCDRTDLDRKLGDRIRLINTTMQQKFEVVRSWFTRPTNQSPSASIGLLFDAVREEVEHRFPNFRPEVVITGEPEVDLIGHRFHFFYDALYILVGNAAQHGKGDGTLSIDVSTVVDDQNGIEVSVAVQSDLRPEARDRDTARINGAMIAEIGDAVLNNRNSGIRTLRDMVGDVEEIVAFRHSYVGNSVRFVIDMKYTRS
ncbi:hypothetical protein [Novosphingobium naphthalenivorans]|uniref:hypothetical protein n=1 Tax=Novosphingobium naphthalenivorans TaxID=273168 RepID=UPI000B0A3075|nr:hypothetical protein [Novosphingobium naphthalenivorans]